MIKNGGGAPTRLGVPSFIALTNDAETAAIAKTIGSVLWDDINYEREFELIPRDAMATIPASKSFTDVPMDRWREIGADGLIVAVGGAPHDVVPVRTPTRSPTRFTSSSAI